MSEGLIINNTLSKLWIEKYRDAGEFEVTGYASSGIQEKLPRGSFVSHVDSTDIMIVENHEITDNRDSEPTIKISGRSFETFLENRIVGSDIVFPTSGTPSDYTIPAWTTWAQAKSLISQHILAVNLVDGDNAIPYFEVIDTVSGTGVEEQRVINSGELYSRVLDILAIDNLGIKVVRPGSGSIAVNPMNSVFVIHKGVDRSATVTLSYDSGDILSADYLWSNKKRKDCALVSGKWVQTLVDSTQIGTNRRMMLVDATYLDDKWDVAPTGLARVYILAFMQAKGKEALAKQNEVALVKADVAQNVTSAKFRKDYNVGDIIMVSGNYGEAAKMRVSEFVEIEDETGTSGHPTLTSLEGETTEP